MFRTRPRSTPGPVLQFFTTSTGTLLAAERTAGTGHHVVLSIVGADRLPDSGYMLGKVAQERLVVDGGVPYTIVRATQFFEFLGGIADSATNDGAVRLPSAHLQPIAVSDLAVAVADVAEDRQRTPWWRWPAPRRSDWTSWSGGSWQRAATRGRWSPMTRCRTSVRRSTIRR